MSTVKAGFDDIRPVSARWPCCSRPRSACISAAEVVDTRAALAERSPTLPATSVHGRGGLRGLNTPPTSTTGHRASAGRDADRLPAVDRAICASRYGELPARRMPEPSRHEAVQLAKELPIRTTRRALSRCWARSCW